MKQQIGRHLSFVECRESQGLGIGGGLAQRATISESGKDVCVVAMGPGRRHITKPVCEITYALREEGINASVLVVNAGNGTPADAPDVTTGQRFGLDPIEVDRINQYKVVLIHLGNVRNHVIYKARLILRNVDKPSIVVSQCPLDFEDFAAIGVKTRDVMPAPEDINTRGSIMEIVTGVVRGVTCSQEKLDEIASKVQKLLPREGDR
ncbi:methyl-coenzyme M reductase I operon protein C [Candidatus Methanomethylophilus sp. 1R26]|jgi:methyl-coenzyme M reductase subunit C|uniref:methyl-coenzyme M reductase I operon protein C n=1 Tax=Candidatus Methanomethylophilus sp. 1R26 TaxID=1769296 RepID=UPI0007360297|nr:methyl-coenzyme M reductase I operon protein C [Candidatus Methanomethylophilus sp. 1R26]MCH3977464.1 methyl-coenzyme M reductase I operon protein C [Methanomethylophilus sp.]TQS82604.1 MAG: methyl-coenzyme M reductase I operon protein C [Methanomethylophilus alvi]WII09842.1 methyl-coenzyme M reductase I operon protein C [Methanomassiliicoccales archaeon LGM-DZ1]KUE73668.1 methyl-coenzyme M reductase I operon protein C [Candidatus Methanomethylophilus sp. 1R26]MCI2075351.1 methyl-coenzyme M